MDELSKTQTMDATAAEPSNTAIAAEPYNSVMAAEPANWQRPPPCETHAWRIQRKTSVIVFPDNRRVEVEPRLLTLVCKKCFSTKKFQKRCVDCDQEMEWNAETVMCDSCQKFNDN